jgi:protease-4
MSESLNRSQYDQLVSAIADARGKSEAEVRALIDQGPFQPVDALRAGLIDEVAYEDELDDLVPQLKDEDYVDAEDYVSVSWERTGVSRRSKIAVINASGVINSGRSGFDPVNGAVIGSDSLVEYIRDARADNSIKAIVLRVDSPGGSSTASDVIWRELSISRENHRPVIVSMSDLAASGGYYIALGGDAIVAQPGTLTGSIGVYTGKFVISAVAREAGREHRSDEQRQARRDLPPDRGYPEERKKIEVDAGGLRPVHRAHRGRAPHVAGEGGRDRAGRVWTGAQAKQMGSSTKLGGSQGGRPRKQRAASQPTKKSAAGVSAASEASMKYCGRAVVAGGKLKRLIV